MTEYRIEKDSLGELPVPADAYYGVHATRSIANFKVSRLKAHPALIRALAEVKLACAKANQDLGLLPAKKANAISKACRELISGKLHDQVPLDVFQAGSGTSTNMNVNEVIANRACELLGGRLGERGLVHPNDDVNKGQSTNNVFPTGVRIAALHLTDGLNRALDAIEKALLKKAKEFDDVIKSARTHLQDAVPIRLGQEFHAYAVSFQKDKARLAEARAWLGQVGVGGNAVGTGINTPIPFRKMAVEHLAKISGHREVKVCLDGVEATNNMTDFLHAASVLNCIAADLQKLASDLRLLASGPHTGLNEIALPPVEPGSSIMPGKVNPSICEAANMACMQVFGDAQAVLFSAQAGQLELNTHMPVIGHNLLEAIEILSNALVMMADKCVSGLGANVERCRAYFEESAALATALNPYIGYDRAAAIVKESLKTGKKFKELVLEKGIMNALELERLIEPKKVTRPNLRPPMKKTRKK